MRIALLAACVVLLPGLCPAQIASRPASNASGNQLPPPRLTATEPSPADSGSASSVTANLQASVDRLTQTNKELLDLLKKQQSVLQDIQYDRRLQTRQIESLEQRLQESLVENAQLQAKIDKLMSAPAAPPSSAAPAATNSVANAQPPSPPPPPASYLPPPESAPAGSPGWHRLFSLSGTDSRDTDLFHIQGHQWRVVWHNQDKPGKAYLNTSALFLNAFPKDDTIPQKVCAKLGSGGDSTQLTGPGNYYVKVEASGGSWEMAVEDFY